MSEKITKTTLDEQSGSSRTDWERADALSEEELERLIVEDPDADVENSDWTKAELFIPRRKDSIHLRIDPDVLGWYKQQGRGYLTRMHAVLRAYYEAHRNDAV